MTNDVSVSRRIGAALFSRYWHTLRHLKPVQFYGRAWFRLNRSSPDLAPAPGLRHMSGRWVQPASKSQSLLGSTTFSFLSKTRILAKPIDWDDPSADKLWRYNLHYFDDLNGVNAAARDAWHKDLMRRWVRENPPAQGVGWEPYPTSLRIVNWIKWSLAGNELPGICTHSLAVQARWLASRLEIHLLGNHLFANAKALTFAGLFFDGDEASRWLEKGLRILEREVAEQILTDGGQFELSPMYHALALEDMLDLCNVAAVYPSALPKRSILPVADWPEVVRRMRRWLKAMCHPDGEISFFNDAAIGIAPSLEELERYAGRLGFEPCQMHVNAVIHLASSGYIRFQQDPMIVLLDVAPVGPDYLPAHAHADTLSFELSLFGQRVIVNSGTSCYGDDEERLWQRGTAAHGTVLIDHENSSDVWGGFRVGQRARPYISAIDRSNSTIRVEAYHDGYKRLPGGNIHQRCWVLDENRLSIEDTIRGSFHEAEARFYLHPSIKTKGKPDRPNELVLKLPQGQNVWLTIEGGTLSQEPSIWHPTFGRNEPSSCLVVRMHNTILVTNILCDRIA